MAIWQTPLCPFTIDFDAEKLDEVRIAVIDGFYAVPHGGVEIGGVLYGTRSNDRVRIEDFRRIETEYLTGPSFHLSDNDRDGLRKLLSEEPPGGNAKLEVVGWFHSHTRSGIQLSPKDLDLYEEFFPRPWQVAMLLRPENLGPVKAGYFFRDPEGNICLETAGAAFDLQPVVGQQKAKTVDEQRAKRPLEPARPRRMEAIRQAIVAEPAPPEAAPGLEPQPYEALPQDPPPLPPDSAAKPLFPPLLIAVLVAILVCAGAAGYWLATRQ
jgi:proteasome lid subunit RPN8/RPN11